MTERVGLKAVALAANVSVSTASLALSGDLRVSAATRERVQKAAGELGYVRDPVIASLAAGRFRHQGKPIVVAVSLEGSGYSQAFQRQATAMGMTTRQVDGELDTVGAGAMAIEASALVINRRGIDPGVMAAIQLPTILWEDESPADMPVDVVETSDWWGATTGAIERVRAAGFMKPVLVAIPAIPRHWHDDVRSAVAARYGIPVLEWDRQDASLAAFLRRTEHDVVIGGVAAIYRNMQRVGVQAPFVALIAIDSPWFEDVAGWVSDYEHRGQVTLELIEQRLRYGRRPPRRIILPPRWRDGISMRRR